MTGLDCNIVVQLALADHPANSIRIWRPFYTPLGLAASLPQTPPTLRCLASSKPSPHSEVSR